MPKPVLFTIDDDPDVLRALERDLRQHYSDRFRVMRASSGASALGALHQLSERRNAVALMLVDQRMPRMSGVELLEEARPLFPDAKRVLLTAYADTDAAIRAINTAHVDYYLLKPWDPPAEKLYPPLDDLLGDWLASYRPPFEGVRVVGHRWSPRSFEVRDFLARNHVPYKWLDVETEPEARRLAALAAKGPAGGDGAGEDARASAGDGGETAAGETLGPAADGVADTAAAGGLAAAGGPAATASAPADGAVAWTPAGRLPVVFFADNSFLIEPSRAQLAERIGLRTRAESRFYDLVIVGGGPAGLAAAVYGASEGLRTLMVERDAPGGQAGTSSRIENYLGFPAGLSGAELARRAVAQAQRFGVEILNPQEATGLRREDPYRIISLSDGSEVSCHALVVATGVSYRKLAVPGIDRLTDAGVYYGAAMTEAISCQGEDVYLVGGANSAGQAAMYFSRYARRVVILVRGDSLSKGMSHYLVDQILQTTNIEVRVHASVVGVHGGDTLEAIDVADSQAGTVETLPGRSLFIFIGAEPRTAWLDGVVERDAHGFLLAGSDLVRDGKLPAGWNVDRQPFLLETSVPGVFVAGDVRRGSVKRVASGVGEGSITVSFIHQHLAHI
ncbi:MAG TPA: FAD-dependent oxidoreductase [Thermoanaerobaculia bacterium]|jgi:thioredoxin reductase (NADPH)|nr:FAD-dependent oxidoreductase [Thermoanaerobaculia bacterium]